ncbi:hypothetical protein RND81_04G210400 [Saponaria officinalis]|uniref:Reverse transcriptase domain-containing protein n=1 Tax=Saponaria officinalis TaxID=3572 RepID=A0AAW1LLV6_SAPOF
MRSLNKTFSLSLQSPLLCNNFDIDTHPNNSCNQQSIKLMVWNVQGAGSTTFLTMLSDLLQSHKPRILVLVETHISGDTDSRVFKAIKFNGHVRVEAEGLSGGIWMFWHPELITVKLFALHPQHLTVEVSRSGTIPWIFSAIYASPNIRLREKLWDDLENIEATRTKPWILAGDFNETRFLNERNGNSPGMRRRCENFNCWIENNDLFELSYSGPPFTWSRGNSPETRKWARLDRALRNQQWRMMYDEASVRHLLHNQSDHCPLLINTNGFAPITRVSRPFRFQAAWMCHEKFTDFVWRNWNNDKPLVPFLSEFASSLQRWNRDVFRNIFSKKDKLMEQIEGIQNNPLVHSSLDLIQKEEALRKQLDNVLLQEELLWFQKSRMEYICDGDRNTRFFYLSTIMRRKRNRIESLQDNSDEWMFDPDQIKSHVMAYYKQLFTADAHLNLQDIPIGSFLPLQSDQLRLLDRNFIASEIYGALCQISPYKALGPDGFQALFFHSQWDAIHTSVTDFILQMLRGKDFSEGLNDTFLTLIPKTDNPQKITQFRPIGLCNVVYKIISKVIVNRIKPILPMLISPAQTSFVPKRQITDNVIIVQEILHSMRKKKKGANGVMALKLDLEKAYNRLSWNFIHHTLVDMRFPLSLINLIMKCISTVRLSVLWNGEPTQQFKPSRGI